MSPDPNSQPQANLSTGTAAAPAKQDGVAKEGNGQSPGRKVPKPVFSPIATAMIILLIVAAIYFLGISSKPNGWLSLPIAWLWMMALLVLLCVVLGAVISNRPLGILVNNRNLMSLSRFQMVAWSVIILSAVLAIVFRRTATGSDPFAIEMDKHLWALLGISTASLVGTPLILQNKVGKQPDNQAITKTATTLQAGGDTDTAASIEANREGTLFANPDIKDARITDMFQGDEVGNTAYVDIAKVQMFLFTVMTIIAYCYAIYAALAKTPSPTLKMPALSEGMIAMLGISHAGYLGSKAADHTPTTK